MLPYLPPHLWGHSLQALLPQIRLWWHWFKPLKSNLSQDYPVCLFSKTVTSSLYMQAWCSGDVQPIQVWLSDLQAGGKVIAFSLYIADCISGEWWCVLFTNKQSISMTSATVWTFNLYVITFKKTYLLSKENPSKLTKFCKGGELVRFSSAVENATCLWRTLWSKR